MFNQCSRGVAVTTLGVITLGVCTGVRAQDPLLTPISAPGPQVEAWQQVQRDANPAISRASFGALNLTALSEAGSGIRDLPAVFELDLFGRSHSLEFTSREHCYGHVILRGSTGDADDRIVLALGEGGHAAASIIIAGTKYELRSTGVGDVHALHQFDPSAQHAHAKSCGTGPEHAVHSPADGTQPMAANAARTPIDVCVFYTPATKTQAGGKGSIESGIAMRIAVATQSSADSDVNHKYTLAYTAETNYTETGTGTDLSRFQSTNDGYMDEVHALRNTYGGDLMALITSFSSQFCGIAYLMTSPRSSFRSSAFSVTVVGCLSNDTLTHEMGHNMGCSHDRQNGGRGVYSYSYGYRSSNNVHRTIMAYSPGSRIAKWSGPNVVHSGFTMGTPTDDNVRSLNNVANVVANFKPKTVFDWELLGGGVRGWLFGPVISFTGTTNNAVPIRVRIDRLRPGAAGVLVVGNSTVNLPIFAATLVPNVAVTIPVTGGNEGILYRLPQLATLPSGTDLFFQAFFIDAIALLGLSATDGMRVTVP